MGIVSLQPLQEQISVHIPAFGSANGTSFAWNSSFWRADYVVLVSVFIPGTKHEENQFVSKAKS